MFHPITYSQHHKVAKIEAHIMQQVSANGASQGANHSETPDSIRRTSQVHQMAHAGSDHSQSPISRTGTPVLHVNGINHLVSQAMLDPALDNPTFGSPSLSNIGSFRVASPANSSVNGSVGGSNLDRPPTFEDLRTRVSELEVINELFRSRVNQLEANELSIHARLAEAINRESELKRRIHDLEVELVEEPRHKRVKLSDIVDDGSQASTPQSSNS
jgi:GATA-binding protein